jgi:hypothetical protein
MACCNAVDKRMRRPMLPECLSGIVRSGTCGPFGVLCHSSFPTPAARALLRGHSAKK